jgi:hypothetical protein
VPDLPILTAAQLCSDQDCRVPIGVHHDRDCSIALCLATGVQRILHLVDPPAGDHDCGTAAWTGFPAGAIEAVAQGWFVRPDADGPDTARWVPCGQDDPGAVPDLDAVLRAGRWNRDRRIFDLPELTHAA